MYEWTIVCLLFICMFTHFPVLSINKVWDRSYTCNTYHIARIIWWRWNTGTHGTFHYHLCHVCHYLIYMWHKYGIIGGKRIAGTQGLHCDYQKTWFHTYVYRYYTDISQLLYQTTNLIIPTPIRYRLYQSSL